MKLHDVMEISQSLSITRVPGGWIYEKTIEQEYDGKVDTKMTSTFVLFNNEFKGREVNSI